IAPDIHPELDRICQRALAPDREERYATAEEFALDLEGFMREHSTRPSHREVGVWLSQLFQDRRDLTRRLIEAQLAELRSERKEVPIVVLPEAPNIPSNEPTSCEATGGGSQVLAPRTATPTPTPARESGALAPPKRQIKLMRLAGLALTAVAAVA